MAEAAADAPGTARPRLVVGVDGSPGSRAALVWALADAARRRASLTVVATFPVEVYWADPHLLDDRHVAAVRDDTEARLKSMLDEVRADAAPGATDVEVTPVVVAGPPSPTLVQASAGADLLVVGSRGRSAVRSTLLGSVALHCVTHARCPVVVVHAQLETSPSRPRVVVGVDPSPESQAALGRALAEAALRAGEVVAVAAYSPGSYWSDAYEVVIPPVEQLREDVLRGVRGMVDTALAEAGGQAPRVHLEVVEGAAGEALVRHAEGADLLVVGAHSRSALAGILLGSVALHCVLHARCPVLVNRRVGIPADCAAAAR
jgi:nucleotide-binding universal stress UspA family protein